MRALNTFQALIELWQNQSKRIPISDETLSHRHHSHTLPRQLSSAGIYFTSNMTLIMEENCY